MNMRLQEATWNYSKKGWIINRIHNEKTVVVKVYVKRGRQEVFLGTYEE